MFLAVLLIVADPPPTSRGWVMQRSHFALAGETSDHVKAVATTCGTTVRFVVAVPEARVPTAFELWGIRFDSRVTPQQKKCVLDATRITKLDYYSQAEADPAH
jgi:hypothetical protein